MMAPAVHPATKGAAGGKRDARTPAQRPAIIPKPVAKPKPRTDSHRCGAVGSVATIADTVPVTTARLKMAPIEKKNDDITSGDLPHLEKDA